MSSNGNTENEVLADLVWDDNDPPIIYSCSSHPVHSPDCEGDCDSKMTTELQVELINELHAWQRAGMNPMGSPASMMGLPFVFGIPVELIDLQVRYESMRGLLIEKGILEEEELDESFQQMKLTWLRKIREINEERIKKQRMADKFGIVHKPILGPGGQPIG